MTLAKIVPMPGTQQPSKKVSKPKTMRVRKDIQSAVDKYITVKRNMKKLEKELEELRGVIEPYMEEHSILSIDGDTVEGSISRIPTNRPPMNARYTSYDLELILEVITDPEVLQAILVQVVDKEALEGMQKLGRVEKHILEGCKITSLSYQMKVQ